MIVLLPISRFQVEYEVGLGRPYSALEWMVLRAVGQGIPSVDSLRQTLGMHPRLIVEALVTLTRAGWLAVGAADQPLLLVTVEGEAAIARKIPPTSLQTDDRSTSVVLERLTGAVIAVSDLGVRYLSRRELEEEKTWGKSIQLPTLVSDNRLDESHVPHLLRREKGEWLRWIGPITMMSKANHWLPLNVDVAAGKIANLPAAWEARLRGVVLAEVTKLTGTSALSTVACSASENIDAQTRDAFSVRVDPEDWLLSPASHRAYVIDVLKEAHTSVQIVSAFANAASLETFRGPIIEALTRGVYIELLWGYTATAEAVDWCRKLDFDCKRQSLKGAFRFNSEASHSHAKLVLADPRGRFEAVVGSYNWLSSVINVEHETEGADPNEVSLRIKHPGVLADISRCIASFWRTLRSERLSATADRSRRLAAEFSRLAVEGFQTPDGQTEAVNATLQLVRDRDHEHLMRAWFASYKNRFLIASHRIGPAAETRLVSRNASALSEARQFQVRYGHKIEDEEVFHRVAAIILRQNGQITRLDGLHAKVLVSDDSACVSSYNFLSADAFGTAKNAREVGVVVSGAEPVGWLASAVFGRPRHR